MSSVDRRTRSAKRALVALQGGSATPRRTPEVTIAERPGRMSQRQALCKICTSHLKVDLPNSAIVQSEADTLYSRGAPITKVYERVQALTAEWPASDRPSYHSLRRHTISHVLDITEEARQRAMERMREAGDAKEALSTLYIDPLVDLSWFLALRARDKVALGELEPKTFRDALRAIEAWAKVRPTPETEWIPPWEYEQDLATVIEHARRHMEPKQYALFLDDLKATGREPRPDSGAGKAN
jgi:hypothetical protein